MLVVSLLVLVKQCEDVQTLKHNRALSRTPDAILDLTQRAPARWQESADVCLNISFIYTNHKILAFVQIGVCESWPWTKRRKNKRVPDLGARGF